jgi:hypothetical protein
MISMEIAGFRSWHVFLFYLILAYVFWVTERLHNLGSCWELISRNVELHHYCPTRERLRVEYMGRNKVELKYLRGSKSGAAWTFG